MASTPPLPIVVALLTAGALAAANPVARRRVSDAVAIAASLAVTGLCALLLVQSGHGTAVHWVGGWVPRHSVAIGISLTVDPFAACLATLTGVLVTAALVYSWRYFEVAGTLYHVLMLLCLAAAVAFSFGGDLFDVFVFFELMSVTAYA